MTSKEYFTVLSKELAENGFHISTKSFGDGYFIFDMGEDSVCHFFIKEIPNWKFGLWFTFSKDEESKNQIISAEIFTRHTDDLDKFKPSRSFYTAKEIFKTDTNSNDNCFYSDTIEYTIGLCKLIKHYPIMTYLTSYYGGWNCINNHMLGTYIRIRFSEKKYAIKRWYNDVFKFNINYIKIWFMRKFLLSFPDIESIEIIDNNHGDWITTPRYDMIITPKQPEVAGKIPTYVNYKISGERRYMKHCNISFAFKGKRGYYYYDVDVADYYNTYGLLAKLFGKKEYIDKIPKEIN